MDMKKIMCAWGLSLLFLGLPIVAKSEMLLSETGRIGHSIHDIWKHLEGSRTREAQSDGNDTHGIRPYISIIDQNSTFQAQTNWDRKCDPQWTYLNSTALSWANHGNIEGKFCSAFLTFDGEKISYANVPRIFFWDRKIDVIPLCKAIMKQNEKNPNYSPLILHAIMHGFLYPLGELFVTYQTTTYGSLVSLAGSDSGIPNGDIQSSNRQDSVPINFYTNFFLWGQV